MTEPAREKLISSDAINNPMGVIVLLVGLPAVIDLTGSTTCAIVWCIACGSQLLVQAIMLLCYGRDSNGGSHEQK
jgi:hypothetical protein